MSTRNDTPKGAPGNRKRWLWLSIFGGAFLVIGAAYSLY